MSDANKFHVTGYVTELLDRTSAAGKVYTTFSLINHPDGSKNAHKLPFVTFGKLGGLAAKGIITNGSEVDIMGQVTMRENTNAATGKTYSNMQLTVSDLRVLTAAQTQKPQVVLPKENPLDILPF